MPLFRHVRGLPPASDEWQLGQPRPTANSFFPLFPPHPAAEIGGETEREGHATER